jgi:preprotein translocase subunit SecE
MARAAKLSSEEMGNAASFSVPGPIRSFVDRLAEYPRRLWQFLHDVRVEMRQVNWPSRQDVWSTTIVVIVTVGFFAAYFFVTDSVLSKAEGWLFHIVKH